MDKNAIKKFAVWARRELIERVSQKALQYGITADEIIDAGADNVGGNILSADEKKQRQALIAQIKDKSYKEVIEEVAYTWFNRFIALRFMEVNGYLPTHVRVFTDEENNFKPQIIDEAIHMELDGLDMERVFAYKDANQTEELYKYLLITQCNALNEILPGMFQKISDYTELLLPDNLLREGSVIEQMITLIPEEDWQDAVQIIGWLYQYYNAEKKDEVFAALKKNVKITKENIPAATQLFTPDWIVRYMVENSLGRLWVEGHPNDELKANWKYYLEEAEQEPEVQAQLAEIRKEYAAMTPEQIKVIDPCCGSGHILAYLFDVLMQIYESYGFTSREAVASILKNNLYGLDIDDRAAQLAYFAVMMKARQYDRRFFSHTVQPKVYAIRESNHIDSFAVEYFCNGDEKLTTVIRTIMDELHDAKEYGSILNVSNQDWNALYNRFDEVFDDISMSREMVLNEFLPLVQVAEAMAQKYDVVCTNPPYMGSSGMSARLADYVKKIYPDSKSDLFAVFIEKCGEMTRKNGYQAMITQHAWMFLSSFEKLREKLLQRDIVNMTHLGARAFEEIGGEVVQTTSFVIQKSYIRNRKGLYCRLVTPTTQQGKEDMFIAAENRYSTVQSDYKKIPGFPIAYWVSPALLHVYEIGVPASRYAEYKHGMSTGKNEAVVRLWSEVRASDISFNSGNHEDFYATGARYAPYNKGGEYRKWYGNQAFVLGYDMEFDRLMDSFSGHRHDNKDSYFKENISWSKVTSSGLAMRYFPEGFVYDVAGCSAFMPPKYLKYFLAFYNLKIKDSVVAALSPTLNFEVGQLRNSPIIYCEAKAPEVNRLVTECINRCKEDWDSFETSWDFQIHPLIRLKDSMKFAVTDGDSKTGSYFLQGAYRTWEAECRDRFAQLRANEEELNRIFIDIYGLQDELTPEVEDKDVTVYRIFDCKEDIPESMGSSKYALTKQDVIKSFISYAVGCMFGRYALDVEGLAYAGGVWDDSKYATYPADKDNIIPICDDEYFDDDIVGRFVKFIEVIYGKDTLEENLKFIADALGGKGQPKEVIRNYFLNDFFTDHCKTYQKRPIYWLFDSGKKNGFKALIYMHRYQPDTIARIRTDYVHEQQSRYRTAIADMEARIAGASTGERVKLNKALAKLQDQATEIRTYEEKIHHLADQMISIDLDDGVKHNYEIFKDVLAKIK